MLRQKHRRTWVADDRCRVAAFASRLGWMAIAAHDNTLCQLTFGHPTRAAALKALAHPPTPPADDDAWMQSLIRRLQAYAEGGCDDFHDIQLDLGALSPFTRRVLERCRRIPFARTVTYAELAAMAGSPRAMRAVGNCMAGNRIPLIIPCHRVVGSHGSLGGYSAPGGLKTKRRLLELERTYN